MERLTIPDEKIPGGLRRAIIDIREVRKEAMTLYWRLKAYEDTGLTPEEIMDGKMLTGWISVAERLPDDGQGVLASDGRYVYLVEYDNDFGFDDVEALAWMPLPDPYECFIPEPNNPYPLCVGRGVTECEDCCRYMHYADKDGNGPYDGIDD